jgi:hypothetical protein
MACCRTFFLYILIEHTYNIFYINSSSTTLEILIAVRSVEGTLWGAEPRFELGPALQQADTLLSSARYIYGKNIVENQCDSVSTLEEKKSKNALAKVEVTKMVLFSSFGPAG